MEFNEKLQYLRKESGLTQEELAGRLYVTRTAISKWESGRGYPNIDSLKAIAKFFGVTVDELLSGSEAIRLAEADAKEKAKRSHDLIYGLVDVAFCMLLFLPLFAMRSDGTVRNTSLIFWSNAPLHLLIPYIAISIGSTLMGTATLLLRGVNLSTWNKCKRIISLSLGIAAELLFIITLQPYAAVLALALLAVKVIFIK